VKSIASQEPLLEHDCSTLGGNSGSCVFTTDTHEVVGLHFGGMNVNEETAKGSANLAIPLSRLGDHHAAKIIRDGTL
jgi:V8-like Glu-specific endopeptidase